MTHEQLLQYPILQKDPELIRTQEGLRKINNNRPAGTDNEEIRMRMDTGAAWLDIIGSAGRMDLDDTAIAMVMQPMKPSAPGPAIIGVDHLRSGPKIAGTPPGSSITPVVPQAPGVFAPGSHVDEKDLTPAQRHHLKIATEHKERSLGETGAVVAGQLRDHIMPRKKKKQTRAKKKQDHRPISELQQLDEQQMQKVQTWVKNYRQRHPKANYDQVSAAAKNKFGFEIRAQI